MKRKAGLFLSVLALLGAAAFLLAPPTAAPKKAGPVLIAMVQLTAVDAGTVPGFREGMEKLGYREGVDVLYLDEGPAGERLEAVIRSHLERKPDLFFVSSTPVTQAVKRLTAGAGRPPVVFAPVNDPVGAGVVADLRRPGGSLTGIRLPTGDDLRLQWLLRIAPGVRRIYLPYTADDPSALSSLRQASEAAERLGVKLLPQPVSEAGGVAAAVAALPAAADAIFVPRESRMQAGIAEFVAAAEKRRLPISAPSVTQVEAGALFSYGYVHRDIGRQAARLADQILRGTAAGDLPVETAENHLAVNLATARRIGIAVPDDVLLQAEYLIRE